MTNLNVEHISKQYAEQNIAAVDNVSFTLRSKHILAILGPSGCGKTTSLRIIAGFETADSGRITLNEQDITHLSPQRRRIGMVFQDYALFPHMTVTENVRFGLTHLPKDEQQQRINEVLGFVELSPYASRLPRTLSGGQQQRVALARSLAPKPDVLLLDEPFSNLDSQLRSATCCEMRKLLKQTDMSVVLVTHDQDEALSFADEMAIMNQGKIVQTGTPEQVYQQPNCNFVANFFGISNVFYGEATGHQVDTPLGNLQLKHSTQGKVQLCLRPEQLQLTAESKQTNCKAVITQREFKGCHVMYHVLINEQRYYVKMNTSSPALSVGQTAALQVLANPHIIAD